MLEVTIVGNHIKNHNLYQWLALHNGHVIGYVYASLEPDNNCIKFFDAHVDEEYRRQGIYDKLWNARLEYFSKNKYSGWTMYSWCKQTSINQFLKNNFEEGETCTYVEKLIQ